MEGKKTAATTEVTTTATDDRSPGIERNTALARATHAAVYLLTFGLFGTGFWLLAGREGRPSVLSLLFDAPDTDIHTALGWGLTALGALAVVGRFGAVVSFFSESVRFSRGDGKWLRAWPRAAVSGRFRRHEGHFDPGQRIANLLLVGGLGVLVASGIGLVVVSGGMAFVWLHRIHLWATYGTAVIIAGHVVIASGILPGYWGVWRAMHGSGRVPETTAQRLWPTWFERRAGGGDRRDA